MELKLLKEDATTKQLVTVSAKEQLQHEVKSYLGENRFNFIITSENIKEAKSENADFNKTRDAIKKTVKAIIDRETETVTEFKTIVKDLLTDIENKRVERVEHIERFESETKETLKQLLNDYKEKNIGILREEFNKVKIEDLVKLTNITAKGVLAKGGKDGINAKIQACLNQQNRYDLRIANLKVICLENGLKEVLTVDHIQGIIYEDIEEKYQDELLALIVAEIDRVAKIEARVQLEANQRVLDEQKRIENIFLAIISNPNESIDFKIDSVSNVDFAGYGEFENYAREQSQKAISSLNITKEKYKEVSAVSQPEPEPKPAHETPKVEVQAEAPASHSKKMAGDGKKMVQVRLTYNVRVPVSMTNDRILEILVPKITKEESKEMLALSEVL